MATSPMTRTPAEAPTPPRLAAAFHAEEVRGTRIATRGRAVALGLIIVLSVYLVGYPAALYMQALLVLLIVNGYLQYAVVRSGRGHGVRYLLVLADFALVSLALFLPNPLDPAPEPDQMLLRHGLFLYYVFLVTVVSLSYAPRLMLFAGAAAAVTWSVGVLDLLARPETVTDRARALDPHYVDVALWVQEVVLLLLITGILSAVVARSRRLVVREAGASRQRANLARYFPPRLVDRLAENDAALTVSRVQPVAVLFADIVGFTGLSEGTTPGTVIALVRRFDAAMEAAVFDHDGTLDKYLGDGVMATFGTPEPGPRDALNAVSCAVAMHDAIDRWNAERAAHGQPPIRLSVGIHQGEVVLGDVGSQRRLEFAVLGDVVNVASRLEAATRAAAADIAVSEACAQACLRQDAAAADALLARFGAPRPTRIRGKAQPIAVRFRPH